MVAASMPEPALRIALAVVRCLLDLLLARTQADNQYETFFFIVLPVSLAFFSVMVGDILTLKKFRSIQKPNSVNRSVLALLNGCEAWQMISICHFEEGRPLAQLFICICSVLVLSSIPEHLRSHLLSASFVLFCFCYEHDVLNFQKHRSGFAISLYALAAVSCALTSSTFLKYCLHLSIVFAHFRHHDCMLSGMILMAAVSRIGVAVAMAYDAGLPGGLPAPCLL
jgi:hypothetical protein